MAPDPAVPTAKGMGGALLSWGIPLVAGVGGLFVGDIFDGYGLVTSWTGDFLTPAGTLPLSDKIDYAALATAGVYGVGVAIIGAVSSRVPGGQIKSLIFRAVKWLLYGIIARLALRTILPAKVTAAGALTIPAAIPR